jgi:DeoR/GlpR family transcriptional regulator of sugar metabolism
MYTEERQQAMAASAREVVVPAAASKVGVEAPVRVA